MDTTKTSKKLSGNGFWESSRMMLPEHKAALIEMRKEERKHARPNVDFEAAEEIAAAVARSYMEQEEIAIKVYNPYCDRIETGIVMRVDQFRKRIRIADEWVRFEDIIAVG